MNSIVRAMFTVLITVNVFELRGDDSVPDSIPIGEYAMDWYLRSRTNQVVFKAWTLDTKGNVTQTGGVFVRNFYSVYELSTFVKAKTELYCRYLVGPNLVVPINVRVLLDSNLVISTNLTRKSMYEVLDLAATKLVPESIPVPFNGAKQATLKVEDGCERSIPIVDGKMMFDTKGIIGHAIITIVLSNGEKVLYNQFGQRVRSPKLIPFTVSSLPDDEYWLLYIWERQFDLYYQFGWPQIGNNLTVICSPGANTTVEYSHDLINWSVFTKIPWYIYQEGITLHIPSNNIFFRAYSD